jgi:colicin import membrane protein
MHVLEAREQRNAFGAALLMHGLLAAALLVSLSWSQKPPPVVQVELWSSPPADRPSPTPPPKPAPPTQPTPQPAPPPAPKADIAVEKKPEPPKRNLEDEARRELAKREAERKAAEKKAADEKAVQRKIAEKKAAQQREAIRQSELARLLGTDTKAKASDQGKSVTTKAGASEGAEVGAKTGVDADYVALIQARIRARITYADRTPGNPEAIVIVEQLPTGEVTRVQLSKSSGIPAWDEAVQRAIRAASPLPKKKDGSVVRTLELRFRPKEIP